jgi:hypothetical protein
MIRPVVVDARYQVAQPVGQFRGRQIAQAAPQAGSDLFEDVAFDGRGGQRLRRARVAAFPLERPDAAPTRTLSDGPGR